MCVLLLSKLLLLIFTHFQRISQLKFCFSEVRLEGQIGN
jgi:hypothetical protein